MDNKKNVKHVKAYKEKNKWLRIALSGAMADKLKAYIARNGLKSYNEAIDKLID